MRILVLGGGVIGVTTAYALMRDGHEVTVIDGSARRHGLNPNQLFTWRRQFREEMEHWPPVDDGEVRQPAAGSNCW